MANFLPNDYKLPKGSNKYMKFELGENKFRVVCKKPIVGYEYWTSENKPIRVRELPDKQPDDLRLAKGKEKENWKNSIKHFWALTVWDYADESIKLLEITQVTIQNSLDIIFRDEDWGHPNGYDIVVTRTGEGLSTEYQTMAKPHKEMSDQIKGSYKENPIRLEALYDGTNPFEKGDEVPKPEEEMSSTEEKINIEDLPI